MGYDLFVVPVSGPITYQQASDTLDELLDAETGTPLDAPLLAFAEGMRQRFPESFPDQDTIDPDWQPPLGSVFFEMDLGRGYVFLGIPFSCVARVAAAAQEIAGTHDLVIVDQQGEYVILPPRFGGTPVEWGTDPSAEELAAEQAAFMAELPPLDPSIDPGDFEAMDVAMVRDMNAEGVEMWSPLGFQITPETIVDVYADPGRVPPALQTAERKAQLLADIRSPKARVRTMALAQLTGWDPDPEVAAELRSLLASDDANLRWQAATGVERQGDTTAFEDVLEVLRKSSPADGGSVGEMLIPVQCALSLAQRIGPEAVERVRRLATEWRGTAPSKPKVFDQELDALLAP